eukprot:COSAG06_NODE_22542_length_720_cov_0.933977_1_plen_68_part_10
MAEEQSGPLFHAYATNDRKQKAPTKTATEHNDRGAEQVWSEHEQRAEAGARAERCVGLSWVGVAACQC